MTQMSQNRGEMKFGEMIRLKMRATPPRSRMTSRPAQQMHTVDTHTAGSATFLNSVTWKIDADEATIKPPADKPTKNTRLYYNKSGGRRYHIDSKCSSVDPQYLPLTEFKFGSITKSPYNKLEPCNVCGAPDKSVIGL